MKDAAKLTVIHLKDLYEDDVNQVRGELDQGGRERDDDEELHGLLHGRTQAGDHHAEPRSQHALQLLHAERLVIQLCSMYKYFDIGGR